VKGEIDNIHHVGLATRDHENTFATYEKLGFVLTPLSIHQWSTKPGEPIRPSGSANRCAIFRGNYLEITAQISEGAAGKSQIRRTRWLKRYEGLHIICFNSEEMTGVDVRLREAGFTTTGVVALERDVDTPEGKRTAKFERVLFAESEEPEELVQVAHHLTPKVVFQERYMTHPNKAIALSDVICCVSDPDEYESKYTRITGRPAVRRGVKRVISLPLSRVTIVSPGDLGQVIPGASAPSLPYIAGLGLVSEDLGAVDRLLSEREIPSDKIDGKIIVAASTACGAAVIFESA